MKVTQTIGATREALRGAGRVGLVPTMGALHVGHVSLIKRARELSDFVVVSIFVNPTQFGPHEDFDRYPRPISDDIKACLEAGADLVFTPTVAEIYPATELEVSIDVPALTHVLEGAARPGHFAGVCRVVAKLLNIVQPGVACFGLKDYQQLAVIRAMAAGLTMPVEIEACVTVRETDGLAYSSRNIYLTPEDRPAALSLSKALSEAQRLVAEGELEPASVERAMTAEMRAHKVDVDYAVVRDARTLATIDLINTRLSPVVCLVAGRVGKVRLIDNRVLGM
jgi:pantoate--beta-alanine ligase